MHFQGRELSEGWMPQGEELTAMRKHLVYVNDFHGSIAKPPVYIIGNAPGCKLGCIKLTIAVGGVSTK